MKVINVSGLLLLKILITLKTSNGSFNDYRKKVNGDNTTLNLIGSLNTNNPRKLETELVPVFEAVSDIDLDFAKVDYVSSAGFRVLLIGEKRANIKQGSMVLISVSKQIKSVLKMTGSANIKK